MPSNKLWSLLPITLGFLLTLSGTYYLLKPSSLISPIPKVLSYSPPRANLLKNNPDDKAIFAFLPYWLVNEVSDRPIPPFTHLAYFGLAFDGDGNIQTTDADGNSEAGLSNYNSPTFQSIKKRAKAQNRKVVMVLRLMDNDDIISALGSSETRSEMINQTINVVRKDKLDGVNIDIEYAGTPPGNTIDNFTSFVREFRQAYPEGELSVDVYAKSARNITLWDLKAISPFLDHVIIMGYDFFVKSSDNAGPVAPLRGSCDEVSLFERLQLIKKETVEEACTHNYDITTSIRDHLKFTPAEKLVLAVPFYGYEWPTTSPEPGSPTVDRGVTATYDRVLSLITTLKLVNEPYQLKIDERSFTPYLVYEDQGQTKQIWFDDLASLKLKRELVDNNRLAGVAVWAWGYEDESGSLWEAIKN